MSNIPSEEIRARLSDLEATAARSAAALIDAEADHRTALKRSVTEGDCTLSVASGAALTEAHNNYDRAKVVVEVARGLLAEAVRTEKCEAQATARAEIEAEIAALTEDAADIDGIFAILVERVLELRTREQKLRQKVRENFCEVSGSPEHYGALRSTATYLNAVATGVLNPDAPTAIARAVSSGARLIQAALNG